MAREHRAGAADARMSRAAGGLASFALPTAVLLLAGVAFGLALGDRERVRGQITGPPATLVVVLDRSGSMAADDVAPSRLAAAVTGLGELIARLPAGWRVGLVGYSSRAELALAPSVDREALSRALIGLSTPDGATATGSGIALATTLLGDAPAAATRAILVVSDGTATTGPSAPGRAERARQAGTRVFAIGIGTVDGVLADGRPVPLDVRELGEVARAGGGTVAVARDAGALLRVGEAVVRELGADRERTALTPGLALAGALLAAIGAVLLIGAARGARGSTSEPLSGSGGSP